MSVQSRPVFDKGMKELPLARTDGGETTWRGNWQWADTCSAFMTYPTSIASMGNSTIPCRGISARFKSGILASEPHVWSLCAKPPGCILHRALPSSAKGVPVGHGDSPLAALWSCWPRLCSVNCPTTPSPGSLNLWQSNALCVRWCRSGFKPVPLATVVAAPEHATENR